MHVNILGISAFYHDAAAALLCDGEVIAAAQEERFTRKKYDARYPQHAVVYCLDEGNITISDLDYVVFYEKPLLKFERLLETYLGVSPKGFQTFRKAWPLWAQKKLHLEKELKDWLGASFRGRLCFADHHESHAASSFFPSPFDEAAILTLDAVGQWGTSSIGFGKGSEIFLTHEVRFPHSLGMLYSAFTYYTGFAVNSGEYKLMGLAPYGEPRYVELIKQKIARIGADGSIWLDMSYFDYCHGMTMTSDKFHDLFGGPPREPDSLINQTHMDLAASIQAVCEEGVLAAARHAHEITGMRKLTMAGGVALNCVANGRLLREGPFEDVWVQPAAGDAGGALGGAFLVWHQLLRRKRELRCSDRQRGSFLGPAFSNYDIGLFLDSIGANYEIIEEPQAHADRVAGMLADGKIIGWFYGRMEYGPRALGARSIIGDARCADMQRVMNLKIKFRESFRPFAPCVLQEHVADVFEMRDHEDSPYMLFVAPVREALRTSLNGSELKRMKDPDLRIRVAVCRSTVPAITHVDYSARVQTVDPERHGQFHDVLNRFYELTGSPVIVNTSFNIRGEPIVCTPEEAYRCFMATDLDCLVLENYLLMKEDQPTGLFEDVEMYKSQFLKD